MNAIRHFREKAGFTQVELASKCDFSPDSIRRWENHLREPRASDIQKLCEVLGVSEAELLNGPAPNELKFNIVWEVNEMNMIDIPNNEVFLGFKPNFNVVAGAFPEDSDPDEVGRRVADELRMARVARDAMARSKAEEGRG
jgi:transcriptional regulator with XRE-family HTH domain